MTFRRIAISHGNAAIFRGSTYRSFRRWNIAIHIFKTLKIIIPAYVLKIFINFFKMLHFLLF